MYRVNRRTGWLYGNWVRSCSMLMRSSDMHARTRPAGSSFSRCVNLVERSLTTLFVFPSAPTTGLEENFQVNNSRSCLPQYYLPKKIRMKAPCYTWHTMPLPAWLKKNFAINLYLFSDTITQQSSSLKLTKINNVVTILEISRHLACRHYTTPDLAHQKRESKIMDSSCKHRQPFFFENHVLWLLINRHRCRSIM
jgi:hypothetical protein